MTMLRFSHPGVEGTLRVSKWLKYQVLLDEFECARLLESLGDFSIYIVSEPLSLEKAHLSRSTFLESYTSYVHALKKGDLPDEKLVRSAFSSIFTVSSDLLYAMKVGEERVLIKQLLPVVQLQLHHFYVSPLDNVFHPMVLGEESVTWGLQFSYPQLYQDPKTHAFSKVSRSDAFPNTELFLRLASWIRRETRPTPFLYRGTKIHVPMRIGKHSLTWVHNHPQLSAKGLSLCP